MDCSKVTPSLPASKAVLDALEQVPSKIYILDNPYHAKDIVDAVVKRESEAKKSYSAKSKLEDDKKYCKWPYGPLLEMDNPPTKAETKKENFCTSLLAHFKSNEKEEIAEAFCRDIDAYSNVFKVYINQTYSSSL